MDLSVFRERLRSLMDARGVQQNVLADAIGVTPATISRTLNGKRDEPKVQMIVEIASYFNVSIDWLLGMEYGETSVPPEYQDVLRLYKAASKDDKRIVLAILSRGRE